MPNLTNLNLKALLKTIEGELQSALYYNSNGIFSHDERETLFYTRKVYGILDGIRQKIDGINNGPTNSSSNSK